MQKVAIFFIAAIILKSCLVTQGLPYRWISMAGNDEETPSLDAKGNAAEITHSILTQGLPYPSGNDEETPSLDAKGNAAEITHSILTQGLPYPSGKAAEISHSIPTIPESSMPGNVAEISHSLRNVAERSHSLPTTPESSMPVEEYVPESGYFTPPEFMPENVADDGYSTPPEDMPATKPCPPPPSKPKPVLISTPKSKKDNLTSLLEEREIHTTENMTKKIIQISERNTLIP